MIPKSGYRFRKRSCSSNNLERDDDSKKSHHALGATHYSPRVQRHHGGILGVAQRERGLHVAHMRLGRQPHHEILKGAQVWSDAFEHEIDLAGQHPAFAHQRLRADEIFERLEVGVGLARQVHHGEHGHLIAKALFVEQRTVSLDESRFLEGTDPAQAWRGRDTDAARQLDIGHAAFVLKLLEDLPIDRVETAGHGAPPEQQATSSPNPTDAKQYCARPVANRKGELWSRWVACLAWLRQWLRLCRAAQSALWAASSEADAASWPGFV